MAEWGLPRPDGSYARTMLSYPVVASRPGPMTQMVGRVQRFLGPRVRPVDWTVTRGGRALRAAVLAGITHEDYRAMIRETYPAQLPPRDSGWWERYGHETEHP